MTDLYKQNQNAYDQIVQAYAARNHGAMPDNLVPLAQGLVQHLDRDGCLLEVGCGIGRDMAWFEAQGVRVIGFDLSSGMLAYAGNIVRSPLCQMNMCRIGFPSDYFDAVWCCASLLHLPKKMVPLALDEIKRVLKPGGMFVLSVQEGGGEGWEESYVPGVQRFFARYQVDEMRPMLSGSGFVIQEALAAHSGNRDWLSFVSFKAGFQSAGI